jgi:asparagine synthase (glutamine-hydrolysing)
VSGIAGVVPSGGAPADASLLGRMARRMATHAPDGERVLALDGCGFAHALLLTGDHPAPAGLFSLDPSLSIVCDARLDGRAELVRALAAAGEEADAEASAAELVLRAYRAWGTGCVERLLGDFAFAVWDAPRRRLFCARDPFGVKLLYHAAARGAFVFSNTLACVLLHPGVDPALDEVAVADFLVRSLQLDLDRTIHRGVRALPPAHALAVEDGRVRAWRWWEPPVEEPLRYRRTGEYAEHFADLFSTAVRERVPDGPVSVLMSGGRDSPAVAAMAVAAGRGPVRAFTAISSGVIREEEGRYAKIAADALGIPVTWLDVDPYRAFERSGSDPLLRRPEPLDAPFLAADVDQSRQAAAHARVLLTGFGGDAALRESRSRLTRLVVGGHPLRAAAEAARYAWHHRRLPRPGVRSWLREKEAPAVRAVPAWIDEGFACRVGLAGRLASPPTPAWAPHPTRPEAVEALAEPLWPYLFASRDPGATGLALEVRHPFFDLRLIRFLLSVPPAQWYNDKGLLVAAMRGRLPAAILRRPKAPLPDDPLAARLRAQGSGWLGGRTLGPEVAPYVDAGRVPALTGGRAPGPGDPLWLNLRPLSLSVWLLDHCAARAAP